MPGREPPPSPDHDPLNLVDSLISSATEDPHISKPHAAIAGAVAGLSSDTLLHPFDTASHRAKVHPNSRYGSLIGAYGAIIREEGLRGLFSGITVTMAISGPATATYFLSYHTMKETLLGFTKTEREKQLVYLASGATAEMVAALLLLPSDVVRSRLQLGANPNRATGGLVARTTNYRGALHAARTILREEGVHALWQGWNSYLLQECVFSALQFLLYENMRRAVVSWRGRKPTATESFITGGLAGAMAAAATNPLDTLTSRLMCQDGRVRGFGTGIVGVLRAVVKEGRGSLWRGTVSRMLYVAPATAVQFAVFEAVLSWLEGSGWGGGSGGSGGQPKHKAATPGDPAAMSAKQLASGSTPVARGGEPVVRGVFWVDELARV